jgi:hypothetical protein
VNCDIFCAGPRHLFPRFSIVALDTMAGLGIKVNDAMQKSRRLGEISEVVSAREKGVHVILGSSDVHNYCQKRDFKRGDENTCRAKTTISAPADYVTNSPLNYKSF